MHGVREIAIDIPPGAPELLHSCHPAMGTEYSLYLYADSVARTDAVVRAVFDEIDRVEALLSNYRESSELSRICREAGEHAVTTDPETFRFLETCLGWSARSNGAFDISVGPLMKAWGFFGASGRVPTEAELAEVQGRVGWRNIQLDVSQRTVRFTTAGLELDPGAIGKGYAVDRAVKVLRKANVSAALLSAGSSTIYALGAPLNTPGWKIQVPLGGRRERTISTVVLRDTSLSTANHSEKYFVEGGRIYGAIMDPRTLRPVEGMVQTTVISPLATDSDAMSNVLFIVGREERAELLTERVQDAALVLWNDEGTTEYEAVRWPAEIADLNGTENFEENGPYES